MGNRRKKRTSQFISAHHFNYCPKSSYKLGIVRSLRQVRLTVGEVSGGIYCTCMSQEVNTWLESGLYWGSNPLILTIDSN